MGGGKGRERVGKEGREWEREKRVLLTCTSPATTGNPLPPSDSHLARHCVHGFISKSSQSRAIPYIHTYLHMCSLLQRFKPWLVLGLRWM